MFMFMESFKKIFPLLFILRAGYSGETTPNTVSINL